MGSIDRMIWEPDPTKGLADYSRDQWIEIVRYLLDELSVSFSSPIQHEEPLGDNVGDGFSVEIFSAPPEERALCFTWKGILGGTLLEHGKRLHISATLFPYVNRKKVEAKDGCSFLELVYEEVERGKGAWGMMGWRKDEFGEYDYFNQDDER